jgi:hypothetical protein
MRISIKIDDGQGHVVASSPAESSSGGPPTTGTAPEPSTGETTDIPRDFAARAAALGALSGGPAPTALRSDGAPPLPALQPGEPGTPTVGPTAAGGSADLSGCAAPGAERRTPQVMVSASASTARDGRRRRTRGDTHSD